MTRKSILALSPLVLACGLATDALAAQRVFVASNGLDTNTCTLASPCRSFAHAMTQVDDGGEIVALNAAGYGAVTITKSVTITTNLGFFAGIAASMGSAISVVAPGLNVVLRGLALNGIGATTGIAMADAGKLTVENCIISGFTGDGIAVTAPATVRIVDTVVRGNGTEGNGDGIFVTAGSNATLNNVKMSRNQRAGLAVKDSAGVNTTVSVFNSDASFNNYGYLSHKTEMTGSARVAVLRSSASANALAGVATVGAAEAAVSSSHVSGNDVGFSNDGTGTFETYQNNILRQNIMATVGTITNVMGQ